MVAFDVSALRAEVLAEVSRAVDTALERVLGRGAPLPAPSTATTSAPAHEPEPRRMKVGQYAAARGYVSRTITGLCANGLPHVGRGQSRRILVAEADAWLAERPDLAARARARLAQRAGDGNDPGLQ